MVTDLLGRWILYAQRQRPLSPTALDRVQRLWPRYGLPKALEPELDPRRLFDLNADGAWDQTHQGGDIWLEVGFGNGEHILAQVKHNPNIRMIGCEAYGHGISATLRHIENDNIHNIRLYRGHALACIQALATASIAKIFVLFPDPWPKNRHAKRRFIGRESLASISRVLIDDGRLVVASDSSVYVRHVLVHMHGEKTLRWLAQRPADWRYRPSCWQPTRYEAKALEAGRRPVYLSFARVPRAKGVPNKP